MGADLAYIGSPFIATEEANASHSYKDGIVQGRADDIVYSNLFTGVHGNYLRQSIEAAGLDPQNLPEGDLKTMDFGTGDGSKTKAWRDIWGSGQGIGAVKQIEPAAAYIDRLRLDYESARRELC
jgi:nitronate monooxygenase